MTPRNCPAQGRQSQMGPPAPTCHLTPSPCACPYRASSPPAAAASLPPGEGIWPVPMVPIRSLWSSAGRRRPGWHPGRLIVPAGETNRAAVGWRPQAGNPLGRPRAPILWPASRQPGATAAGPDGGARPGLAGDATYPAPGGPAGRCPVAGPERSKRLCVLPRLLWSDPGPVGLRTTTGPRPVSTRYPALPSFPLHLARSMSAAPCRRASGAGRPPRARAFLYVSPRTRQDV